MSCWPDKHDPIGFFATQLWIGLETLVYLKPPVPVYIVYRTAFTQAKGDIQFSGDLYIRDAEFRRAVADAGVALRAVRG